MDRVNGLYNGVNIQAIDFDGYDDVFDDMSGSDGVYRKSLNFNIRILNSFNNIYSTNFDGVDDYVAIDGINSIVNSTTGSISVWAKTAATEANGNYFKTYVDSNNNISLLYNAASNEVRINYKGGGTSVVAVTTEGIEDDGLWHHIVGTWNVTGDAITLYLDGVKQSTTASLPTFSGTPTASSIGNNAAGGGYFIGNIDEVSFFNITLSDADVTTLYNEGLPYTVEADTGLILYSYDLGSKLDRLVY